MYANTSSLAIAEHPAPGARGEREPDAKSGPRSSLRPVAPRLPIPALLKELLEAKVLSQLQVDQLMATRGSDGRRLTTRLVEAGFASEGQLTQVLSQQFSVPWISLCHVTFSEEVLNLVSWAVAEENCLIPLFVRHMRPGKVLYLAIDDPSDELALHRASEWAAMPVRAMVAPPSAIRSAIRDCYSDVESCW
jgi:Type II secretion system (T2SS), protein E, N-terminal domain